MTTITKLPGSKWWVETDDVTFEIVGTHNKAQVSADIAAITETLKSYPDITKEALVVSNLLVTASKDATLINKMYEAYQGDTKVLEAAQLKAKLDWLNALLVRLV